MAVTIEIPGDLHAALAKQAAERGIELDEFVERILREALGDNFEVPKHRVQLPLIQSKWPGRLTAEDVIRLQEEDLAEEDRLRARFTGGEHGNS